MFPLFIGLVAVLGAAALSSIDASYIKLTSSTTMVMKGEIFIIDIYAYAHVPVNAVSVSVGFDPDSVKVLSVDKAQSVLNIWTEEPTVTNGRITLSGGTYRRGFVGEHLVASIKAQAVSSGRTDFNVDGANLLAGDGSGTEVDFSTSNEESIQSFIIYNQGEDPAKLSADIGLGISADIDGDGEVTLKDISSFMSAWYTGSMTYDFNNDARMNFIDFSIILARSFTNATE
jgi:hypothetical protein